MTDTTLPYDELERGDRDETRLVSHPQGGAMTATIDHLAESFNIQEPKDSPYFYLCCRICKLTWYLPKAPERRTKEARDILADHAVSHGTRRLRNGGAA